MGESPIDSAKYRASRLIQRLEECELLAVKIRDDEKAEYRDRLEAGKTACEAAVNIFKLINEGPTFRVSLRPDICNSCNIRTFSSRLLEIHYLPPHSI